MLSNAKHKFQRLLARARGFRRNEDGATAVEFTILLIPFSALIFAIIELGIVFFIQVTMAHALQGAAREIRTGQFQTAGGAAAQFKELVCEGMAGLGDCGRLRIDVVTSSSNRFEDNMLPDTPTSDPANPDAPPTQPGDNYTPTGPRTVAVVRAQYYHKLAFPGEYTRLANASGNTRILSAVTAFRTEPFS